MNFKYNKSSYTNPIFITILIYICILVVLSIIVIEQNFVQNDREILIEFAEFEKIKVEQNRLFNSKKEPKPQIAKEKLLKAVDEEYSLVIKSEISDVLTDSNLITKNDTLENKFNWLDSLVVANPNLQMLKYASEDYIRNNPILKSDSVKVAEGIRHFMQDYYKSKYPTPVHKFGDGSPGIAIDDIINLFKSDDVDEEKIKKYLKIGKYK